MKESTHKQKETMSDQPRIPDEVAQALSIVLDHLWRDEAEDYLANPREDHIFCSLQVIDRWLGGSKS